MYIHRQKTTKHWSPIPTPVFDAYWYFAAERLAMYYKRIQGEELPWTKDPILSTYRFTNTYRITDRVTQYLVKEIQYHPDRSQTPEEVFFRTIVFKLFNKIETWEALEEQLGPLTWEKTKTTAIETTLTKLLEKGKSIYSAAYIIPAPKYGAPRKHTNHLRLIEHMMETKAVEALQKAKSLKEVYTLLSQYPSLGRFLSFQFAIDLNYSSVIHFDESEYVVAGPGAIEGITKCFTNANSVSPEQILYWVTKQQEEEIQRRGIVFPGLFGRKLQPIDCQNLFCEVGKYARVKYPQVTTKQGRKRIKQVFKQKQAPLPTPFFPPKWKIGEGK